MLNVATQRNAAGTPPFSATRCTNPQTQRHGVLWSAPILAPEACLAGPGWLTGLSAAGSRARPRGVPGKGWDQAEVPWPPHLGSGRTGAEVASGYTAGGAKRRKVHDGGRSLRASEATYYT